MYQCTSVLATNTNYCTVDQYNGAAHAKEPQHLSRRTLPLKWETQLKLYADSGWQNFLDSIWYVYAKILGFISIFVFKNNNIMLHDPTAAIHRLNNKLSKSRKVTT